MRIVVAGAEMLADLAPLRAALWPDSDIAELAGRIGTVDYLVLAALSDTDAPIGFAEIALRRDYVNGCNGSPVAFLEGIYVDAAHRRRGVAHALVEAAIGWSRAQGAAEFASDALLDNLASHTFHAAIGFEETERVVYFRRPIPGAAA